MTQCLAAMRFFVNNSSISLILAQLSHITPGTTASYLLPDCLAGSGIKVTEILDSLKTEYGLTVVSLNIRMD